MKRRAALLTRHMAAAFPPLMFMVLPACRAPRATPTTIRLVDVFRPAAVQGRRPDER